MTLNSQSSISRSYHFFSSKLEIQVLLKRSSIFVGPTEVLFILDLKHFQFDFVSSKFAIISKFILYLCISHFVVLFLTVIFPVSLCLSNFNFVFRCAKSVSRIKKVMTLKIDCWLSEWTPAKTRKERMKVRNLKENRRLIFPCANSPLQTHFYPSSCRVFNSSK